MRRYVCLSVLLGVFAFLAVHYSFLVAFGVMYFGGMLVIIVTAFAVRSSQQKRLRSAVLDDKLECLEGKEQFISKNLHAA